jgi:hypothetical protein
MAWQECSLEFHQSIGVAMSKFEFRDRGGVKGLSAEVVGAELERIRTENDGKLQPPDVVQAARPKDSPLHPAFEWKDSIAANQYRLWQARNLIKSVRVVIDEEEGDTRPAYVHVRMEEQYYQEASVAVKDPGEWASAVMNASAKLQAARRALDDLERIARGAGGDDKIAMITLAVKSLSVASDAVSKMH